MKERENSPEKKKIAVSCDAIIIVGLTGSGKSTLIKSLAEVIEAIPLSTSNAIRSHQIRRKGEHGHILGARHGLILKDDIAPDRLSRMYLQRAISKECPIILDGRRAALEALYFQDQRNKAGLPQGKFLTIFVNSMERMERVWKREKEKNPNITLEEATRKTLEREAADIKRWKEIDKAFPGHYYKVNPYDLTSLPYDLILDNRKTEESVIKIIEILAQKNWIKT